MNFVLAAGGTGGHMVPAHALAAELHARGHGVLLITDERGARFPGLFDKVPVHILPAGRLGGGPLGWHQAPACRCWPGGARRRRIYRSTGPTRSIGFGGYPAFPSLLAASARNIPTVLHEQNAVLGRVNRLLAGEATAIATAYPDGRAAEAAPFAARWSWSAIRSARRSRGWAKCRSRRSTRPPAQDPRHRRKPGRDASSARSCPTGSALLEPSLRHRLQVVQQCRPDDIEASARAMPSSASRPS